MVSQKSLMSISLHGRDVFLFSEYEHEKNLILKLLDIKENESFIGQASALDLRTQAARIRLTFKDYLDHAMNALFQSSQEEFNYVYSLEDDIFKWKSIDQDETIINLGFVPMKKLDYVSAFKESLLCLAKELRELNSTIQKLNVNLAECKNQTTNALNLLSETIDAKESLETEMYAKFSLVLNEKKKLLRGRQNSSVPSSNKTTINHNVLKTKHLKNVISDSSEEDADELIDLNKPGPSTSVKRNSLFDDDDEECVVPLKPSKMRNRNNANKRTSVTPERISDVKTDFKSDLMFDDDSDDLLNNL